MSGPELAEGWIDPEVAAELPGLRLVALDVAARVTRSEPGVEERLRGLSDRFRGPQAVQLRQQPVPSAYRVFFRHIGLDPDVDRTPVEALALQRLKDGAFKARNSLDDALTVATMETGVPVWALDADRSEGPLGIRLARAGSEALGRGEASRRVPGGRLVVADAEAALAVLFGPLAPGHGVTPETERMTLFSVLVAGVPPIYAEEALWLCGEMLTGED